MAGLVRVDANVSRVSVPDAVQHERRERARALLAEMMHRRAGTVPVHRARNGPGSAAHHSAALRAALRPGHGSLAPMREGGGPYAVSSIGDNRYCRTGTKRSMGPGLRGDDGVIPNRTITDSSWPGERSDDTYP